MCPNFQQHAHIPGDTAYRSGKRNQPLRKLIQSLVISAYTIPHSTHEIRVVAITFRSISGRSGAPRHPVTESASGTGLVPKGSTANSVVHQISTYSTNPVNQ